MDKILKEKIDNLPEKPGSYQYLDKNKTIIYVGKAKNLKKRVKSYFTRSVNIKTSLLVNEIDDLTYTVTSTELESLLLEINLIKKYNPKYNILLKDDKSYPYIELIKSSAPILKITRSKKHSENSLLFGPFPNVKAARNTLDIVNRAYPLRKCNTMPKKVCLYYHINECLGYCEKKIDEEIINDLINKTVAFLNNKEKGLKEELIKKMHEASERLDFEKALEYKNTLNDIDITLKKQLIDLNKNYNFDMFSISENTNYLGINIFIVREGKLLGSIKDMVVINDNLIDSLEEYILMFYEKNLMIPKDIYVPYEEIEEILEEYLKVKVHVAKKDKLKKLSLLGSENAKIYLEDKLDLYKKREDKKQKAIKELNNILNKDIKRIELFDNSHLFGTFYVGAMVVYDYFEKNKNLYRKYKLEVDVKDDLAAMREVLYRRYYKVLMKEEDKCDLIIVDGADNQINVAKEIINNFNLDIEILGLKKDKHHNTYALIDSNLNEIPLDKSSSLFLYLTSMQDEVHNFAINYHKNLRDKGIYKLSFDFIKGIGEKRKKELLKKYKSIEKLKEASIEDLCTLLPEKIAEDLYNFLHKDENNE